MNEKSQTDGARPAQETYQQSFGVSFEYPVHFTSGIFDRDNSLLMDVINRKQETRQHRAMVFVDDGVEAAHPSLMDAIEDYAAARAGGICLAAPPQAIPGGERAKRDSWNLVQDILSSIGRRHLCRQSYVIAIGGGSMLDIVGLAASLVHRGLRLIRIPTSVLAQNDAAVGVKNGVDALGMKNFAGTFAPPFAVLIDTSFLRTLPDAYWYGGLAEAFKVAIITDRAFFESLCASAAALGRRDEDAMAAAVKRSAILHLEHIRSSGDPFEFGEARPLDFGHWSAHRLEILSGYGLTHGQCVGIGIALDTFYACEKGMLTPDERDLIMTAMQNAGITLWADLLEKCGPEGELEILRGLTEFQEHLGGRLNVTLPDGIGSKREVHEMDPDMVREGVAWLRSHCRGNRV